MLYCQQARCSVRSTRLHLSLERMRPQHPHRHHTAVLALPWGPRLQLHTEATHSKPLVEARPVTTGQCRQPGMGLAMLQPPRLIVSPLTPHLRVLDSSRMPRCPPTTLLWYSHGAAVIAGNEYQEFHQIMRGTVTHGKFKKLCAQFHLAHSSRSEFRIRIPTP